MKLDQFEYHLSSENIAHSPTEPRDHSKLLILDRNSGKITHKHFFDLDNILTSNDVLVLNDTKVFPARIFGKKITGGNIEILLLKETNHMEWQILGKNIPKTGDKIVFPDFDAQVLIKSENQVAIKFNTTKENLLTFIEKQGQMPLPPYITSPFSEKEIRDKYQTIYARETGSVAAPTAGLHFTQDLLNKLRDKGVQIEYVTLHVGAGTFLPIKEGEITNHKMHSETFSVTQKTADSLVKAKANGRRIVAVGTTTTRVLETLAKNDMKILSGETDIFIYPPYNFKFVDSLITNFHLPHSTLLALVSAFVTEPNTNEKFSSFSETVVGKAYKEAIEKNYKFYSFGDGMIIL